MSSIYRQLVENRDKYLKHPARLLAQIGLTPTLMNGLGLVMGLLSGLAALKNSSRGALTFLCFSAAADVLDGPLARLTGLDSRWGEIIDASSDRAVDATIYSALLARSILDKRYLRAALAWFNLIIDLLRSYARARAEASLPGGQLDFKLGVLPRAGKMALLMLGFARPNLLTGCLTMSAVMSTLTVLQRLQAAYRVYRQSTAGENP